MRVALTLLLAWVAAQVCVWLATPIPWMIGPLLATSLVSMMGAPTESWSPLRNTGQWVIGAALGLYFTPEVGKLVAGLWWAIALGIGWALALGLVDRVVDRGSVVEEAVGLADTIAQHGPIVARYAKEAVRAGQDLSMAQGMRLEADLNILLQSTEDRAEGIRSFIEKRPPVYRGE